MKKTLLVILAGVLIVLLILLLFSRPLTQVFLPNTFDTDPQTVIFYIDMHYPGIPEPTAAASDRYCPFIPYLRVWGDNLALVNDSVEQVNIGDIKVGFLKEATRAALFNEINKTGFFSDMHLEKTPPNPSGTSMLVGVKLQSRDMIERGHDIGFINYGPLESLIRTDVSPLKDLTTIDPRIKEILRQYGSCNIE